jgi:signal transduction histidine kinase
MEDELREAVLVAERANRTKTEFLSRASHEIRTPLTGIIGFAEILQESECDPRLQQYLGTIQDCSRSLLQVLNDLLDLGKIELGAVQLEYEACNIRVEIDQVLRLFRPSCDRRGVALASAIAADVPEWLWLSRKQVRQILVNLVGNAVKFTAQGTITVEAAIEPRQPTGVFFVLRVVDTGVGIPPALQPSMFEPFSPAQRSGVSDEAGTGLGLAICKQLCALMDASLEVSSHEGQGTTPRTTRSIRWWRSTCCAAWVRSRSWSAMAARPWTCWSASDSTSCSSTSRCRSWTDWPRRGPFASATATTYPSSPSPRAP